MEGSYQELLSSGFDFTKLLGSSEQSEFKSDYESFKTNSTENSFEVIPILSRQDSAQSVISNSSVIDETHKSEEHEPRGFEPVKVVDTRSSGNVSRDVYFSYVFACGNIWKICFILFILIFTQVLSTAEDYWISYW